MMMYHKVAGMTTVVKEKEAIHSGHFMVSHFEAEEQDDEDEVAVPVPDEDVLDTSPSRAAAFTPAMRLFQPLAASGPRQGSHGLGVDATGLSGVGGIVATFKEPGQHLSIETSLSKLFQCMSLAYR